MSDENNTQDTSNTAEVKQTPDAVIQVKTADTKTYSLKEKCIIFAVLAALLIGSGFMIYNAVYNYMHKDNQIETQQDMQDPAKVKSIVSKDFGLKIDNTQAKEIARTMQDGDKTSKYYRAPERTVIVPGKSVMSEAENFKKSTSGDIVVTTDPTHPNEKVKIDNNQTYTLEQRSYKLYPDKMASVTVYNDSSVAVSYDKRVKVLGNTAYVGVSVLDDKDNGSDKVKAGVKITIPF
jgi:cell division protein FtsL